MSRIVRACAPATMVFFAVAACVSPSHQAQPKGSTAEFSQLDAAGVEQIKKTRHARFDLRDHELTKAAVGLEGQNRGPIVGGADQPAISLELLGPTQAEIVETSTMMFLSSTANEPYEGIVFWRAPETPALALAELREDITIWGLNPEDVDWWEKNTQGKSDIQQVISMGVGRSGLVIDVEAYLKNGKPLLKYDIYLNPEYYTPEAQESIRRYGKVR